MCSNRYYHGVAKNRNYSNFHKSKEQEFGNVQELVSFLIILTNSESNHSHVTTWIFTKHCSFFACLNTTSKSFTDKSELWDSNFYLKFASYRKIPIQWEEHRGNFFHKVLRLDHLWDFPKPISYSRYHRVKSKQKSETKWVGFLCPINFIDRIHIQLKVLLRIC